VESQVSKKNDVHSFSILVNKKKKLCHNIYVYFTNIYITNENM